MGNDNREDRHINLGKYEAAVKRKKNTAEGRCGIRAVVVERVLSSECLAYIWLLGTPLTLALDANQVLAFISVFKQGLITVAASCVVTRKAEKQDRAGLIFSQHEVAAVKNPSPAVADY